MKIAKRILFVLLALVFVFLVGMAVILLSAKKETEGITIPTVDLTNIGDGTYSGEYKASVVSAKVNVTVKDHRMTKIEVLEHNNGLGQKAEGITSQVIAVQNTEVTPVSGATLSSKVILKAIENALTQKEG